MRKNKAGLLALLSCAVLSGCLNNRYIAPVTAFQTSANNTVVVLSAFYSSRNSYETQLYLDNVAADPSLDVGTKDATGKLTPLGAPVFSAASIKARLDALSLVGIYATRLYALANTSAPADFSTAATALGTSLTSLNNTFTSLGAKDATAASYVGSSYRFDWNYRANVPERSTGQACEGCNFARGAAGSTSSYRRLGMIWIPFSFFRFKPAANEELVSDIATYNHTDAAGVPDRLKWTYDQRVARLAAISTASATATSASASAPSQLRSVDDESPMMLSWQALLPQRRINRCL